MPTTDDLTSTLKQKIGHYLCPPGQGVYTVHTAKERKENFYRLVFSDYLRGVFDEEFNQYWKSLISKEMNSGKIIFTIGVCSDSGGGILRGANWGPLFIREKLAKQDFFKSHNQHLVDLGDIKVIPHLLSDKYLNSKTIEGCRKALYGDPNLNLFVSPLSITEDLCDQIYKDIDSSKIFAWGGDHSVSYPLVKSYIENARKKGKKVGLIHFDAHTDLLEERLGIDLCFASWTAHILKYLESPNHVFQVGIRSSAQNKQYWEKKFGINQYWTTDINEQGVEGITEKIIKKMEAQQIDEIYISFDIDAIDSYYASATGTPESNGLKPDEASRMIHQICSRFPLGSADLVEVAPFLKTENAPPHGSDMTVSIAASLSEQMISYMQKN